MVAGVILMLSLAVEGSVKYEHYFIINEVPVGIIVFTALILLGVAKKIILKINRYRDLSGLEYYAEFEYCGVLGRLRCFLDTGNRLYDERNGLPIVVVSANKFFATISLEGLNTYLKEGREMFYSAVCGKSKMTLIKPDFFRLYSSRGENILIDVMIGIVFGKLNGEHDAILPLSVIN